MSIGKIYEELSALKQVEAIALGGSRSGSAYDEKSDYDLYVYTLEDIPEATRREILQKYCVITEIGNHYWEYEDNCRLKGGADVDIIYRSIDDFDKVIRSTVVDHAASNGYTTCMWYNLLYSVIIFDRNGRFADMQKRYNVPYPEELRENIIHRNMSLLSGVMPSYDMQIKKAVKRRDLVSINHRTAEFLASYFDVIFAMNRLTHPGEKRLVSLCTERCRILPDDLEADIERLFEDLYSEKTMQIIGDMVKKLRAALERAD